MKVIAIVLMMLAVDIVNVRAESTLTFFRHITVEDGLSSNQVRSMIQDEKGFIWIGTDQGLTKYDGYDFQEFPLPEQWTGATLLMLFEHGTHIYIGTDKGLFIMDSGTQKISPSEIITKDGMKISSEVNNICMDLDGNIWISTYGQGAFCYDPNMRTLKNYPFSDFEGKLSTVYVDKSNQVWALTNWGSPVLSKLNKSKDEFSGFVLHDDVEVSGGLVLMEDSDKRFWLGSWDEGLFEIDRLTGKVRRSLPSTVSGGLNHIHSIIEYDPGILLIGSDDGLLMYNTHTKECWSDIDSDSDASGLSNRFVYPILKDREGSIWVGTYYGGINYYSPYSGMFDKYSYNPLDTNSLRGKVISGFCEDSDNNIWIASDDGGLSHFNIHTGRFTNYVNVPGENSLSYNNVHALCMDGDDLWIGTYTGGVNVFDTKTGKFRQYFPEEGNPSSIDGTSSYAIFKDSKDRIWVATMIGINLYDREKDSFIRKKSVGSQIVDIDQDSEGNIWFSSQGGGLLKYDEADDLWISYSTSSIGDSSPGDYVNCGYRDGNGTMWFGTNGGVVKYDPETDGFDRLDMGWTEWKVCGIIEDKNILWITTTHGMVRYDMNEGMHVFSTSNGLCSNQFIVNSIFKASDGRIYAGTINGFNVFHPYQITTNKKTPNTEIISLTIDNKPVPESDFVSDSRIELFHNDNSITLHYASLSFCVPYKNQYVYMLEGFDHDWNYVGNNSKATYTNLPAGTYRFLVRGSNNDAVWSEAPASLEIVVHPHILLSTSFKILYIVIGTLLILLVMMWIIRKRDLKHAMAIGELEERKEKEVYEAKIRFFTMIAHEIRTPVSLIIGPLEKVIQKADKLSDKAKEDLKTVERNSQRLLYLVNQLLDFRKVEQDSMVMKFVSQPIEPLLRSVCERFEPTINHNDARLEIVYPQRPLNVSVDGEALTKLVSNLLSNACKYTKDYVRLSCSLDPDDERYFRISVYDNGCGISPLEQNKIFLPFYQTLENKPGTGIGLSLVKSIAELHGGSVSIKSEVGNFTEFTVLLPVSQTEEAEISDTHAADTSFRNLSHDDIINMDLANVRMDSSHRILVVDDNDDIVRFLADTLSVQYDVLTASDGIQAGEIIDTNPDLSLVIADWMMPELDGIGLCRRVRENLHSCHIPFVLLTAKSDDASKVAGMDCGADAYIEKPFSIQYLEACLKNLIMMRETLRQRYASSPLTSLMSVANNSMDNRFLQTMTRLIEENMSDSNLSVEFLTEQMGISRSSFYSKIKSLTDRTPNELIQLMRLKKAALLLRENKYRINEVCYMVGFNNPSYFSKCFAKQFGMKPGEFASKSIE